MWELFFIAWYSLFPFIAWRGIYEGAKIFWLWVGGFFLILFWIIKLRHRIGRIIKKADLAYFAWLLILLVASLLGIHPLDSLVGGSYRHQGVLFFFTLWIVGKSIYILSKKGKRIILKAVILGVVLQALVVLVQTAFGPYFHWPTINGRPIGLIGEPNAASGYLAIGSILLFSGGLNRKIRPTHRITLLLLIFLAIVATQSRTGLLVFWVVIASLWVRWRKIILTGSGAFLKVLISTAAIYSLFIINSGTIIRGVSRFENRVLFWDMGLKAVLQKPLLGYGAESGEFVYNQAFSNRAIPLQDLMVERSHNLLLDVALWSGIIGFGVFVYWLTLEIKKLRGKRKYLEIIGVSGLLFFSMLQPLGVIHWLLLFLLLNI